MYSYCFPALSPLSYQLAAVIDRTLFQDCSALTFSLAGCPKWLLHPHREAKDQIQMYKDKWVGAFVCLAVDVQFRQNNCCGILYSYSALFPTSQ